MKTVTVILQSGSVCCSHHCLTRPAHRANEANGSAAVLSQNSLVKPLVGRGSCLLMLQSRAPTGAEWGWSVFVLCRCCPGLLSLMTSTPLSTSGLHEWNNIPQLQIFFYLSHYFVRNYFYSMEKFRNHTSTANFLSNFIFNLSIRYSFLINITNFIEDVFFFTNFLWKINI